MAFLTKRAAALALASALVACAPDGDGASVTPKPSAKPAAKSDTKAAREVKTADVDGLSALAKKPDPLVGLSPRGEAGEVGTRDMLKRVPKEALFVLRFPHVEQLRTAWNRAALAHTLDQLTNDPKFAGLTGGGASASDAWNKMIGDLLLEKPELKRLIDLLPELHGELLIAVTGPYAEDPNATPFQVTLLYDAQGRASDLKAALEPVLEFHGATPPPNFTRKKEGWGFEFGEVGTSGEISCEGELFSGFFGAPPAVRRLKEQYTSQSESKSFLASEVARSTPDLALGGNQVVFEGFVNLAPLREFAMAMLPPPVLGRVRAAGLLKLEGLAAAVALEGDALSEALVWCSPGQRDLFSRALTAKPLERTMARWIPAQCDNAGLYAIDLESLLTDIRVLLPEEARRDMERGIDDLRRFRGVDLDNDLFANLGPTLAVASRGDFSDWIRQGTPSICLAAQVGDEAAARRLMAAAFEDPSHEQQEQITKVAGCEVHTFPIDANGALGHAFSLSWAIDQHCLVLATDATLMASCLESAHAGNTTSNARFRDALTGADESTWCIGLSTAGTALPPTVAIGRANESALVVEARKGSGALVTSGFVGTLGMLSGVAVPQLVQARNQANERAAVAFLRSIWSGEHQAIESVALDRDHDGVGEALFLDELVGLRNLRGTNAPLPRAPVPSQGATCAGGLVERTGYLFRVDLPPQSGESWICGGSEGEVSAERAELAFLAYAWPQSTGASGARVYAIDGLGEVWFSDNVAQQYSGRTHAPAWNASGLSGSDAGSPTRERKGGDSATWTRFE